MAKNPTAKREGAQRTDHDAPIPFDEALRRLVNTPPKPKAAPKKGKKAKA